MGNKQTCFSPPHLERWGFREGVIMRISKTFVGEYANACVKCGLSTKGMQSIFVTSDKGDKELWHKQCWDNRNAGAKTEHSNFNTETAGQKVGVSSPKPQNTAYHKKDEASTRQEADESFNMESASRYAELLLITSKDAIVKIAPEVIEEKSGYGELLAALVRAIHGEMTTGRLIKEKTKERKEGL